MKWKPITNAFCPTGEGGGQDNSCSPAAAKAQDKGEKKVALERVKEAAVVAKPAHDSAGDRGPYMAAPFKQVESSKQLDEKLRAKMDRSAPKVRTVAIDQVVATQKTLSKSTLRHMIKSEEVDLPVVVSHGGKKYLYDGHHRVAALVFRGKKEFEASVY